MGRSSILTLRFICIVCLVLSAVPAWSTSVGMLVDAPSKQIQGFKQQLASQLTTDTLQLVFVKDLSPDLIAEKKKWITLGPNALTALLEKSKSNTIPILALFLPDDARQSLQSQYPNQFTYLDNTPSLERQFALISVMTPQLRNIAVYYTGMFTSDKPTIENIAKKYKLRLHWAMLKDPLDWDRNALKVLSSTDLVLGVDDSALYNTTTIRSILMRLYRSGKPLIGPDKGYVRAGAVASVFSGIKETLQASVNWIHSDFEYTPRYVNPYFQVDVNAQVARSLNIVVDDEAALTQQVKERLHEK